MYATRTIAKIRKELRSNEGVLLDAELLTSATMVVLDNPETRFRMRNLRFRNLQ
jgi:hypothetical protein